MKKNWILWSLLGLITLALPACKDDEVDPAEEQRLLLEQQNIEISNYLQQNSITATKNDKGIYREVLQANPTGDQIQEGDVALVHYKLSTLGGTLIGSSEGKRPVRITYSPTRVYFPYALQDGLEGLREGETYRFYIPSPYAFGKYSDEQIPANSIVVLEYQVLEVYHSLEEIAAAEQADIQSWLQTEGRTAEELANGVYKVSISAGSGAMPVAGDSVKVYYKGYNLAKEVFDENLSGNGFKFKIGAQNVVPGFEQAVKSLQVGEKALFLLPSAVGYGSRGAFVLPQEKFANFKKEGYVTASALAIPPFSTLLFELELVEVWR